MSIPVDPHELAASAQAYGSAAYVLTTDPDGRPRVNHVRVSIDGDRLTVVPGGSSSRNAADRPAVSVLWPAVEEDGYSLIADGEASVTATPGRDSTVEIVVTSAVLHRPAPRPA